MLRYRTQVRESAIGPKSTRKFRGAGEFYLDGGYVAEGVPGESLLAISVMLNTVVITNTRCGEDI